MKKPKRTIMYGAGMLAMAMSVTACRKEEINATVYGPPEYFASDEDDDVWTGGTPVHATGENEYTDPFITDELVLGKGESSYGVIFTTESPVSGFRILALEMKDVSRDGVIEWDYEEVYVYGELRPNDALLVYLTFNGAIPNNGISYVDAAGEIHYFTVSLSGDDGTIQLNEW